MLSNNIKNADETWAKTNSREGVVCYERKSIKSYYMEHRTNAVVDASIDTIFEILKDIPAYPEWMYYCTEAMALEGKDDFSKVIYYAQGSPLVKWDSDIILSARMLADLNNGKIIVTLKSIDEHPYQHPDRKVSVNRIRMVGFAGSWRLTAVSKTSTMVSFTAHANPGKSAYEYMLNNQMQNFCFYSLQGLIHKAGSNSIRK